MKKYLFLLAAGALLMSGCKDSKPDNTSNTITNSSESVTQTDIQTGGQSSAEMTVSEPGSESYTGSQDTSANNSAASVSASSESSPASVQSSSAQISSSVSSSSYASSSNSASSASKPESRPESSIGTASTSSSSSVKLSESSSVSSSSTKIPEPPTVKEENDLNISITVNGRKLSATLYDTETAKAFKALLPLTLDMSELNGNEKYYYLSGSLPTAPSRPSKINTGDIMLYGNSCLVIFYDSFSTSYSYTPIGKIDDPGGLAAALGTGDVRVIFNVLS